MELLKIFGDLGLFAILIAGLAHVAKSVINNYFDKDVERFKSDLEKSAIEHQIRYTKLHEERAYAIKELYKKLVNAERWMKEYVSIVEFGGTPPIEERRKKASESHNEFLSFYQENKIYFSKEICCLVDEIVGLLVEAWVKFKNKGNKQDELKYWDEAWKAMTEKLPKVKSLLEEKFRQIIGVE